MVNTRCNEKESEDKDNTNESDNNGIQISPMVWCTTLPILLYLL